VNEFEMVICDNTMDDLRLVFRRFGTPGTVFADWDVRVCMPGLPDQTFRICNFPRTFGVTRLCMIALSVLSPSGPAVRDGEGKVVDVREPTDQELAEFPLSVVPLSDTEARKEGGA
jgi:hypothetical protein